MKINSIVEIHLIYKFFCLNIKFEFVSEILITLLFMVCNKNRNFSSLISYIYNHVENDVKKFVKDLLV